MQFPNHRGKQSLKAMFEPADFIRYYKKVGRGPTSPIPKGVILCYDHELMDYIIKNHPVEYFHNFHGDIYFLKETKNRVAVIGKFGIGAPSSASTLEELIAFGVRRFISIGTAGTLQKSLKIGDVVVCERAIRDEGTSYHYVKSSKYAYASKKMIGKIETALKTQGKAYTMGTSWTIDAPYRETIDEARKYQKEGVATVDMEASAIFAVAEYRNVELGAVFTISDSLAGLKWNPKFHHPSTKVGLETLFKIAVQALEKTK